MYNDSNDAHTFLNARRIENIDAKRFYGGKKVRLTQKDLKYTNKDMNDSTLK